MTEDEARKLWCPFARDSLENYGSYNRQEGGEALETCRCLASGCMAWRWYGGPDDAQTNGWCGLAGAP